MKQSTFVISSCLILDVFAALRIFFILHCSTSKFAFGFQS